MKTPNFLELQNRRLNRGSELVSSQPQAKGIYVYCLCEKQRIEQQLSWQNTLWTKAVGHGLLNQWTFEYWTVGSSGGKTNQPNTLKAASLQQRLFSLIQWFSVCWVSSISFQHNQQVKAKISIFRRVFQDAGGSLSLLWKLLPDSLAGFSPSTLTHRHSEVAHEC